MRIARDIHNFLVTVDESLDVALIKISANKRRCVFVVDAQGRLFGSLSDGDVRRWLLREGESFLTVTAGEICNPNCTWIHESSEALPDNDLFHGGIDVVPVLDQKRRVVAVLEPLRKDLRIGSREISVGAPAFLIAEIGINHNGNIDVAKALVDAAGEAGADAVKLQLRDLDSLYRVNSSTQGEDLGAEYTIELVKEANLTVEATLEVLDYAQSIGLVPLCTPWDHTSAEVLVEYGIPAIKVASADLTNHPFLSYLSATGTPLIVSTGMSTENEIREAASILNDGISSFAVLHCNSAYPAPFKDLNLAYMERLVSLCDCHVGYSGHERGHHAAVAAVAMGARIIEKHITLDRRGRGNDHRVSLEPDEFGQMVREIREIEAAIGSQRPRKITQGEALNRLSLAKSIVAARDLSLGEIVQASDVTFKSPGRGLKPSELAQIVGITLRREVRQGDFFFPSDVDSSVNGPRNFTFSRPWGLPVRFHDWRSLASRSNPDFLEFHLSYSDLKIDYDVALDAIMPFGLVVHAPDLFEDDLVLDLAAQDRNNRARSIQGLQRVIDLTRDMLPRFSQEAEPLIVASLGGSSLEALVGEHEKEFMYERVNDSLSQLDTQDVILAAQTLPPYPWYLGGQRYCHLFVDPEETVKFSQEARIPLCFDVAHTKLATNWMRMSFSRAAEVLLPRAVHLHLVDASGVDNEGLQILEGEIDWESLAEAMSRLAPTSSFIPEIWQGHVDDGAGFWTALDRLERVLQ